MAYKKRFNDEFGSPEGFSEEEAESAADVDFYTGEVNRYADTVERDLGEAFKRYGFTLYPVSYTHLTLPTSYSV